MAGALGLAVSGCATTPLLEKGQTGQIVEVNVTRADERMGTRNLVEDVRVKTQNAAYRYSESGPEKILNIQIVHAQMPNPGMAIFVTTGSSSPGADVTLTNVATQTALEPKRVFVQNFRPGGLIGAIAAASVDAVDDERALASQLAENILRQVYGDKHADSVEGRVPTKTATANYPVSYAEEKDRMKCLRLMHEYETAKLEAKNEDRYQDGPIKPVPARCAKYDGIAAAS